MSEKAKMIKIITVSAVIFLFLLICSLIINLVQLAKMRSKENHLRTEIAELDRQINENQGIIDYLDSDEAIERYAREYLNMQNNGDKNYTGKEEEE